MGLEAIDLEQNNDATARLIAAGRALLAQGNAKFPLTRLCTEAGVEIADFHKSFASKAALLQALMEPAKLEPTPAAPAPLADPWLERRLRVFERALNALEERAEKNHREQSLRIAQLEEQLAAINAPVSVPQIEARPAPQLEQQIEAPILLQIEPAPEPESDDQPQLPFEPALEESAPVTAPILLTPLEPKPVLKIDADFLEPARRAAQERARELETPAPRLMPWRLVGIMGLAVLALVLCAVLTLVHAAREPLTAGEGTAHRSVAVTATAKLMARADSGDPKAQTALAFAYLRGTGVPRDEAAAARWAQAAAVQGEPTAQYLIGSLSLDGAGVARDPAQAFFWFQRGAMAGNVKAMHNLAIAYAQGLGIAKDAAQAAEWFSHAAAQGYVDSAFDLAVLYERGEGVPQSAADALRWYKIAAREGDGPAAERAHLLETQAHL